MAGAKGKSMNPKAVAGRERKAAAEQAKKEKVQREQEEKEAAEWQKGRVFYFILGAKEKSKKVKEKEEKLQEKLQRKKEAQEQLKKEEAAMPSKPLLKHARQNTPPSRDTTPTLVRGEEKKAQQKMLKLEEREKSYEKIEHFAASSLDDALDLMEGLSTDVQRSGTPVLDRHPERRVKAAYAAYEERMMPILKNENPTLRHSQLKELLRKMWQKAPENPFNQVNIAFNADKAEEKEVLSSLTQQTQERLRIN